VSLVCWATIFSLPNFAHLIIEQKQHVRLTKLKLQPLLTMSHNKTIPKIKAEFLLGNLRQMKANPFQALCDWQRDYSDLVSFRLAIRHFYLISHPKLVEQALIKQSDIFVKMYDPKKTNRSGFGVRARLSDQPRRVMATAAAVNAAGFPAKKFGFFTLANCRCRQ